MHKYLQIFQIAYACITVSNVEFSSSTKFCLFVIYSLPKIKEIKLDTQVGVSCMVGN